MAAAGLLNYGHIPRLGAHPELRPGNRSQPRHPCRGRFRQGSASMAASRRLRPCRGHLHRHRRGHAGLLMAVRPGGSDRTAPVASRGTPARPSVKSGCSTAPSRSARLSAVSSVAPSSIRPRHPLDDRCELPDSASSTPRRPRWRPPDSASARPGRPGQSAAPRPRPSGGPSRADPWPVPGRSAPIRRLTSPRL